MKARILVGDALETLKTLPDNSVDAIVTDPPYGLSDSSQASPARIAAEFMLPDDAHFITEGSGACVLTTFMHKIVQLHPVSIQPRETPTMPVGAVALDDQAPGREHDIEHAPGAPNACADSEPQITQHLGYLAFKAADASTFADMVSRSGGELQTSSLRIGLGVGAAGLPGLLASCLAIDDSDPNVGAFNDALAVCIGAAARAKDFAVPALTTSGAAQNDLSASAALVLLGVAKLGGAQLVRAKPGTRGLSAKLQALRIRVIIPGADRALSFDLLVHPRGLARGGFMGKGWDSFTPGSEYWRECLRVAKPGAHIVAFSGTRTGHRLACAIEDAGWELRDCLMFLHGQGFPKSHNIHKAINAKACKCDVRPVSGADVPQAEHAGDEQGQVLLSGMPEQGAPAQGPASLDGHEGREQPGMEGWGHVQTQQGQLHRPEVRQVSGGVRADGSDRRVCDGAQASGSAGAGSVSGARGGSAPQGSQHAQQHAGESGAVSKQRGAQTCGRCGKARPVETGLGWGTALKPAWEPIYLARKPLVGTVAANVLAHGTGAINVDACRIAASEKDIAAARVPQPAQHVAGSGHALGSGSGRNGETFDMSAGRWPANLCLDESAAAALDASQGSAPGDGPSRFMYCAKASRSEREAGCELHRYLSISYIWANEVKSVKLRVDTGRSPPRVTAVCGAESSADTGWSTILFGNGNAGPSLRVCRSTTSTETSSTTSYPTLSWLARSLTSASTADASSAMASSTSPAASANSLTLLTGTTSGEMVSLPGVGPVAYGTPLTISESEPSERMSIHPTMKPISLMQWLIQLITPPGGIVLDPFNGSGSTGCAAVSLGHRYIGCELNPEYVDISYARMRAWAK